MLLGVCLLLPTARRRCYSKGFDRVSTSFPRNQLSAFKQLVDRAELT